MNTRYNLSVGMLLAIICVSGRSVAAESFSVPLPAGVRAVWELEKAERVSSGTRERICVNGLWRWQPAGGESSRAPTNGWGYFKVPGSWPGITDYMQKDSQTVFAHPSWADVRFGDVDAAWYEREISIPSDWTGRRIALAIGYLNSFATVFVDGRHCGEMRFPSGELDLSRYCRPGSRHVLTLFVAAMPLKAVMLSYSDSNAARFVEGTVKRRGLCGDLFLIGAPPGPRLADVKVDTSVRKSQLSLSVGLEALEQTHRYSLRAQITSAANVVKELSSREFSGNDLQNGRFDFSAEWKPEALWDLHTPDHQYELTVSLHETNGGELDVSLPVRFGFREFWIDGRDYYLNGTRIWLSAVPLDNAQVGAALANYASARESLQRLKDIGINFVYTHNYGCEPGSHLSFTEILRAADDVGMLVSLSQPHFSHYDWKQPDADVANGYAAHAEFYVRVAQNHPSVVAYAMSHNSTGYSEDMNPDMIDGIHNPRDSWSQNNAALAMRAESIVKHFDSSRIVYHHASGNLGSMHTSNFYPNFAPIQELSDWFEHWAIDGTKPLFTCEYAAPFTWDWTMYRGWYNGEREFGSARVPWEFALAEWNSQFLGDETFKISEHEAANLRWEAQQFRAGKVWHRWDYPHSVGSPVFDERFPVFARYLKANWPAFRTWGVSAISPWEYGHYWKVREGVDRARKEVAVDWENLQRPGISPDYIDRQYERMDLAFERPDWIATEAAEALLRYNRPMLAYIAGKASAVTSQDHLFVPGETIEKQIVVINNSRQTVNFRCEWSLNLPEANKGAVPSQLPTGEQERVPVRVKLPENIEPGKYSLNVTVTFDGGERQTDSFSFDVLRNPRDVRIDGRVALFDPKGETTELLNRLGVRCEAVDADADLAGFEILIIGKTALGAGQNAPEITRVRDGLKVLVFEQTPDVLEKRLGFRIAEYGLREVFARVPDHPVLNGVPPDHLRDWRGEATTLPPRLSYELRPRYGPTVNWCGMPVTRIWRCGNRGNVASVLIEKPARGDFLPIVDGGFSLQYSPLLEYREGKGVIVFCQLDVTGRTEREPAAEALTRNLLRYIADWKPAPRRSAVYVGESEGRRHLESAGIRVEVFQGSLTTDQVLVLGPGGGRELADYKAVVSEWLNGGGQMLAIGLDQEDVDALVSFDLVLTNAEHISAFFEPASVRSPFTGIGPADLHNRDPRRLPLISAGASAVGNGILGMLDSPKAVFCQMAPWQFERERQNTKRTFRRSSFALARLLANLGVAGSTPILKRFSIPIDSQVPEQRWLDGLYLDEPKEWDDPYRFFRW